MTISSLVAVFRSLDYEEDLKSISLLNQALSKIPLSFVSSVFDPTGLVAPYTVRERLLLKEIWRIHGQQWDDELPVDIKTKFLAWHSDCHL